MDVKLIGLGAAITLVAALAPLTAAAAPSPSPDIDQFVSALSYDPTRVLVRDGEKVTNPTPTTGELAGGRYTVVTREKRSISADTVDLPAATAAADAVYPGALVRVDGDLADGRPTVLPVARGAVTLSVDLPGLTGKDNALAVSPATKSATRGAVSTLLERWNATVAPSYPNVPANYTHSLADAYGRTQLEAKLGLGFEAVADKLDIDFKAIHKGERQTTIASFRQVFYTASVDEPTTPSSFVAPGATAADLRRLGVSAATPPGYVSSVSYGRQIFVKMETSSTSTNVKAAFKAVYQGEKIEPGTEFDHIVKSSTYKAVVLGGSAPGHIKVLTGNLADMTKAIEAESTYSRTNPGSPISYTVRFLKDNKEAVVSSIGEYVETTVSSYTEGRLRLNHTGGYVARFAVSWDEASYNADGTRVLTRKQWDGNHRHLTSGYATTIPLPANATNVSVWAAEQTGLAWEGWRTIVDERNLALVPDRVVSIWGTTLSPRSSNDVRVP